MLKGVNKQVLEISETENGYFEKAIFFVKPEYSGFSEGRLRENARRELAGAGLPPRRGSSAKKSRLGQIILCVSLFSAGAILGMLIASSV